MKGYLAHIEEVTKQNTDFRRVLYTSQHTQLVVMHLKPLEDIGLETHEVTDQFIRVETGNGIVIMDGVEQVITDGDAFVIPAGTEHNIVNKSASEPMKLYTLYCPPHHKDGTVHATKEAAATDSADHL